VILGRDAFDRLEGEQGDRPVRTAVGGVVPLAIALDPGRSDPRPVDRPFGNPSGRDIELEDATIRARRDRRHDGRRASWSSFAELVSRAEANGVRFLGMGRDVERIYEGLDIFVLPSHREDFPRAAMEAAASGLPVIATDIRGCRQVVEHGVNGFLFPVKDVEGLTGAIARVGADGEMRSRISRA
jgi:glycosyltransferase involved in cell wall biosynthesis